MWTFDNVWMTHHAVERVRQHHPHADLPMVMALLNAAMEIEQGPFMAVVGRKTVPGNASPSRYFLAPQRNGVFVLEPRASKMTPSGATFIVRCPWAMVTYLRLTERQTAMVDRLWTRDGAPIAVSPTKKPGAPAPPPPVPKSKTPATDAIRACLSLRWVSADDLAKATGFKPRDLTETLCALKHAGEVEMLAGPVTHWRVRET